MAINMKRRKAVMSRSIKLGHCVCNPKLPCPCPVFKEHNVCTCAGERLPVKKGDVALTRHVRKAGCASKIGQADLVKIISNLPPVTDPRVLVGAAAGDDAGIYKLDDRYSLVQTVDVFSPCVDDPYLFGQISAANSLSDVYAMGGKPLTALSIVGFPIDELDGAIMEKLLKGGMDKLEEANCPLVGGHSINDEEIKCGFAITGLIDERRVVERGKARPGDVLVLTKPLGTGMVAFGAQIGRISKEGLDEVGASMAALNKDAAELMVEHHAHACTDVTGFGLAGHLVEMARESGLHAEVDLSALPVFAAAGACLENEILPGAIENNQEYSMAWVEVLDGAEEKSLPILYDPQTSGGLLIALEDRHARSLVDALRGRGNKSVAVIGRMVKKKDRNEDSRLRVTGKNLKNLIGKGEVISKEAVRKTVEEPATMKRNTDAVSPSKGAAPCCGNPPVIEPREGVKCCDNPPDFGVGTAPDALPLFMDFMTQAGAEGRLDLRTKKFLWVALSVGFRCKHCMISHFKTALEMGITREEIDEAANLGIAFGGCSAMLLYREVCKEMNI